MCLQYVKLKTRNQTGIRYAYVPCGKCVDCRRKMQSAWQWRLNSEFHYLREQSWHVAFCTLTYDEAHLPHIPAVCYQDEIDRDVPCFSRSEVQDWIRAVRQYCKRKYHFVDGQKIRYFISSEYGETTHRPHYHAILAWPSTMSYQEMHEVCTNYWNGGTLYPRDYLGDAESNCKSFEITGDASKALNYVSKYVCKDLSFIEETSKLPLYRNHKDYIEGTDEYAYAKAYEDCVPFHLQSQSLGFTRVAQMTDDEKHDVYVNGLQFVGNDDGVQQIPLYIKNKLVYDNYYMYEPQYNSLGEPLLDEEGNPRMKRLCRRKASAFFERYRREIFVEKAKFYQTYITGTTAAYLKQCGVKEELADKMQASIDYLKERVYRYFSEEDLQTDNMLGAMYLAYHRCRYDQCFDMDLCEQWMRRYRTPEIARMMSRGCELYPHIVLEALENYWLAIDYANSYVGICRQSERDADDRLSAQILDYFNNVDNWRFCASIKV